MLLPQVLGKCYKRTVKRKKLEGENRLSSETLTERLERFVITGQEEAAEKTAIEILNACMDPLEVIEENLFSAMKFVGEKFEKGEYFVPELLCAAAAMEAAIRVLTAEMKGESKEKLKAKKIGRVVVGTVSGDIHDIGKNILALLLEVSGFDTYDLGKDVDSMKFIEKAAEVQANIIALSALMTTTRPAQKEVVEFLNEMGLRGKYVVMVGGAPTSKEWAEEIAADGWAETAEQGVKLAQTLIRER